MKKTFLVPAVAVVVTSAAVIGIGATQVFAQTNSSTYPSIVQALATKFNLDPAQVESVFQQNRETQKANAETRYEAFLTKAVTDGKLTQAQEQLILAKHKELQANQQSIFQSYKNMTVDQRKAAMQQARTDLQNWAKTNGVDVTYLFGGMGRGHFGRGMGRMGMKG